MSQSDYTLDEFEAGAAALDRYMPFQPAVRNTIIDLVLAAAAGVRREAQ